MVYFLSKRLIFLTKAFFELRILYFITPNILRVIKLRSQDIVVVLACQAFDFKKIKLVDTYFGLTHGMGNRVWIDDRRSDCFIH